MDVIGKIYPASLKGHSSTDYLESVPLKKAEQMDVIQLIK